MALPWSRETEELEEGEARILSDSAVTLANFLNLNRDRNQKCRSEQENVPNVRGCHGANLGQRNTLWRSVSKIRFRRARTRSALSVAPGFSAQPWGFYGRKKGIVMQ
jgi:hypothetical protein